jgi:hypothetical protein
MEYRVQKKREEVLLQTKLDAVQEEVTVLRVEANNSGEINIMDMLPPDSVVEFLQRLVLILIFLGIS